VYWPARGLWRFWQQSDGLRTRPSGRCRAHSRLSGIRFQIRNPFPIMPISARTRQPSTLACAISPLAIFVLCSPMEKIMIIRMSLPIRCLRWISKSRKVFLLFAFPATTKAVNPVHSSLLHLSCGFKIRMARMSTIFMSHLRHKTAAV